MIEDAFSAALTFALLIGGTLAIGSEMTAASHTALHAVASSAANRALLVLPTVDVIGHRAVLTLASTDRPASDAVRAD